MLLGELAMSQIFLGGLEMRNKASRHGNDGHAMLASIGSSA